MKISYQVMRLINPKQLKKQIPVCIGSYNSYEKAERYITRVFELLAGKPEVNRIGIVEYHIKKVWTNH
jgi:hypothetical protein